MERFFNIAGPCNSVDHYMLPAMAMYCSLKTGGWDAKFAHRDVERGGKTIHVFSAEHGD